ncbi:MAG: hypothetical protein QOG97_3704 [Acidimicrobiaceae bacterium]|jgi:hypothetical protein|nr:hypothetical protein [Acidimicrobiaceae bacterium]
MHGHKIIKFVGGVVCVAVLIAVAFVVHTFHGGNLQKARQIAVRLQAAAMANPSPVAGAASPTSTSTNPVAGASTGASATTAPTAAANGGRVPAGAKATTAVPSTAAAKPGVSTPSAPVAASAATKAAAKSAPAASTVSPRRQPTSAEVAQAIVAVHDLLPFFTPTADQIASVGNQVCTGLDQGTSFAQLKSQALDMVGAGSISWMIPSSVPEIAIRTVVALYCPNNASKLH